MQLFFDLDAGIFVTAPGTRETLTAIAFKRGDTCSIAVQFLQGVEVQELATGASGILGIKANGDYSGDYIASDTAWTKTGTGTATLYTFDLNLATTGINAILSGNAAFIFALLEMEFLVGTVRTSSNTVTATIYNDVIKGDESGPVEVTAGTPHNQTYATLAVNPAGSNNSFDLTAVTTGAAGEAVSFAIAAAAVSAETAVAVVGNAVTVTPGTKARMVLGGTLLNDSGDPITTPLLLIQTFDYPTEKAWSDTGNQSSYELLMCDPDGHFHIGNSFIADQVAEYPDLVISWTPQGSASGTPILTAETSSASQVIAALTASTPAAAFVTAAANGTVTGAVAATATAWLSGGSSTSGFLGSMKVDSSFLYVACALDSDSLPIWKKVSLSSL